ncbi:MAG: hypothetical protein RIS86_362, partial [Planctomycetota bacterium]
MKPRSSCLRSILCTLALGICAACGPGTPSDDAGVIDDDADSDVQDAGTTDAGTTDAGATDAATTDAGLPDGGPPPDTLQLVLLTGIYYVPPQSDVSTYDVGEVEWTNNDGIVSLSYQLPRMLVGNSIQVQLAGPVANDGLTAELT